MSPNDDIVLDLNFVPAWARLPADQNPYAGFEGRPRSRQGRDGDTHPGRSWNRSRPGTRDAAPGQRQHRIGGGGEHRAPRTFAPAGRPDHDRPDFKSQQQESFLEVAFIPERRGLKPLAHLFAKTARAYSLMEVASMFLSRPEFHAVKLEVAKNGDRPAPFSLFQCRECQTVFLDREQAALHGFAKHFSLFYDQEETQVEPPKGNFVCVARCSLSGCLLGPPNYHEYNDRLLELHRTRFASLPLEEYRNKIVNDTDPSAIEQWKKEVCRRITYRTRRETTPHIFKRRSEAETHFRERAAPGLIREGHRFIVPGTASRQMEDPTVIHCIQRAWTRENRFPLKMAIALHPAFRSYGLTIFKTPDKTTFITAIHPHPIDPSKTLEVIRRILEHLVAHPGTGRTELVGSLLPGVQPDSPPVAEFINSLRWLIDKGHVIEFSNGNLAVPYRKEPVARSATGSSSRSAVKS
ncbi:MAG: hypothetical protein KKG09_04920 [Verrucomicrobia bacterium]|nr:hypothetical protein [Verrucomicrobiota bacterium]MCG2680259.1 hypothetical protein [Kiritimatiellia bacterium]MBU4248539.1 hypothetical protein [Verrucomicrobiota bacterium]MBU4289776.1 hypothetical protein [Verrucomicrobiota bacterium]MBU4429584.1 hypothetical protein [Verrucomicrobiota bacterium]